MWHNCIIKMYTEEIGKTDVRKKNFIWRNSEVRRIKQHKVPTIKQSKIVKF